jgi:hypothetical protein
MTNQWITWEPRGRDIYTNPRARKAHFANPDGGPCACGIWVPDDFDAIIKPNPYASHCKRCERSLKS